MKKIYLGFFVAFALVILGIFQQNVNASVNDFKIANFSADYYLSKNNENKSTLKVIEKITAVFPEYDQNHGIERFLPNRYDGHSIDLNVMSVRDEFDNIVNYSYEDISGGRTLRIGDANTYVHGEKTYVITYSAQNVTKYFSNTSSDEFYWDINGTGWNQSFDSVSVNLHLESGLEQSLTGKMACYYGVDGASNKCEITRDNDVISTTVKNLKSRENVTISVGFNSGTFLRYQNTLIDNIAQYAGLVGAIVCAFGFVGSIYILIKNRGAKSRHAITPEYLPPKGVDVMQSSVIINSYSWLGAVYIDLAVRHKIKIIELEKKILQKQNYRFELINSDGVSEYEKGVLISLFGESMQPGSQYDFKPNSLANSYLGQRISKVFARAHSETRKSDYYITNKSINKLKIVIIIAMIVAVATQFIAMGINDEIASAGYLVVSIILLMIAIGVIALNVPLSQKGRDLKDYLEGLKMYIKVGEQERLKILQSPDGAEKTAIDTNDKEKLIHLYERVLPYAILFGLEKNWSKVLETYYQEQNIAPIWYSGVNGFSMSGFQSSISSFSSSSSSSSSGGSSGGGSSGGGGGGGGGGGW